MSTERVGPVEAPLAYRLPRLRRTAWLEREGALGWVLVAPAVLVLATFIVYPFFVGIWLSLSNETVAQPGTFVGLQNFVNEARSQIFQLTVRNTLVYTFVTVVVKGALGLALAIRMNQAIRGTSFIRAALLLPWIVPTALSTIAWKWLFDSTYSISNWVMVNTGLAQSIAPTFIGQMLSIGPRGINWLGDGRWAMVAIIVSNIWRGVPFFAISILAGLQTISQELYEAASIDGATAWRRFLHVTLPLVQPVLLVVLLFSFIWTISDFQLVYVLTGGGPANSTHLFSTLAYQIALRAGQLGDGAAVSLYMFPFLFAIVVGLLWYMRRQEV
jgi:multiple sugar transport system permease protein